MTPKLNKGYSLVEMIIYLAILSIVSVLILNTLLSFTESYRTLAVLRVVEHSGIDSMERMTRDIRSAYGVDLPNSTFGTSPGVLTLNSTISGASKTTKFYVQNGTLKVDVNGAYFGPLTSANTTVTNLVFDKISNTNSTAIRITLTVSGTVSGTTKVKTYHDTIILRGQL